MTPLEKAHRKNKSRECCVLSLVIGALLLMLSVTALAQQVAVGTSNTQPPKVETIGDSSAVSLKSDITNKETSMNPPATAPRADAADAIRPFHVDFPKAAFDDLRRRIAATRWPDQETVPDQSQGVQLATMKSLMNYWQKDYDWRRVETKLFVNEIRASFRSLRNAGSVSSGK